MNKSELVTEVAKRAGQTKVATEAVLDAFTETVHLTVQKGEEVSMIGFGTFHQTTLAAHKGRNPSSGAEINVPEKKVVRFKVSKNLQRVKLVKLGGR
jgi:DNA-binding protein HU-beta